MRTAALIKQIQREAPKWSTEDIRELINEVQRIVYSNPVDEMRMMDTSTGFDPLLSTTAGTYEYTINTAAGFDYDAQIVYLVYTTKTDPQGTKQSVDVIEATETTAAKIRFRGTDPGTGSYYVWAYRKPPQVTSTSVQLTIPPQYHLKYVKEAVMGQIELSDSGRSDRWEKFETEQLPKLLSKMNSKSSTRGLSYTVKHRGY